MPISSDDGPIGTVRGNRLWKRFRDDLRQAFMAERIRYVGQRVRGRHDPSQWRWALRDVDFHIEPGEAVGLIGSNGSGKSTLLKMLSGVMYPYAGGVAVAGRIGALIEVRGGIHPDLTGKENIYLYGSLLGLRRKRVAELFDAIVDFAQLDQAINRQVKFYSSGMQMRLGFGVAAFLEPDVLLVDEVLAVGDSAFQQRCLQRMSEVHADGTTLVLVSHDLAAVEAMCSRALWLEQSFLRDDGNCRDVLNSYRKAVETRSSMEIHEFGGYHVRDVTIRNGKDGDSPRSFEPLEIGLTVQSPQSQHAWIYVGVTQGPATAIFTSRLETDLVEGQNRFRLRFDDLPLPRAGYSVWCAVTSNTTDLVPWHPVGSFEVMGPKLERAPRSIVRMSPVQLNSEWQTNVPEHEDHRFGPAASGSTHTDNGTPPAASSDAAGLEDLYPQGWLAQPSLPASIPPDEVEPDNA